MQHAGSNQSVGAMGTAKIASESACVVYHSKTGDIVHVHRVANFDGAMTHEASKIEARALELALNLDQERDRTNLRTLSVNSEDIRPFARYKVDLRHQTLVEAPRPRTASAQARKRKPQAKRKR